MAGNLLHHLRPLNSGCFLTSPEIPRLPFDSHPVSSAFVWLLWLHKVTGTGGLLISATEDERVADAGRSVKVHPTAKCNILFQTAVSSFAIN